jgi:hypothetical protein
MGPIVVIYLCWKLVLGGILEVAFSRFQRLVRLISLVNYCCRDIFVVFILLEN